jgi:hypothetical protein
VNKDQWRDVTAYIDSNYRNGDSLIFTADWSIVPFNFYSKNNHIIKKKIGSGGLNAGIVSREFAKGEEDNTTVYVDDVNTLCASCKKDDRVWLVEVYGNADILNSFIESFELVDFKKYYGYYGIRLYLFRKS